MMKSSRGNGDMKDVQDSHGGHWLHPMNPEYDQIKYYLKTCIGEKALENLEIWKIENLELSYRYERKTSNMLKVACWLNAGDIEGGNTLEDVCRKGFSFDKMEGSGMTFSTGKIDFGSEIPAYAKYSFVYTEVAVGKPFVYDGDFSSAALKPPIGYDSFYIPSQVLDRNKDGEFDLEEYQAAAHFDNRDPRNYSHKYFVVDPSQVNAKYIVRFDLTKKVSLRHPSRAKAAHESFSLGGSGDELTYFDPVSLTAVSQRERMAMASGSPMGGNVGSGRGAAGGGHSGTDASNLVPIEHAFQQAMADCHHKDADPVVNSKKSWIERQLNVLEEKARSINLNYAEVGEAIADAAVRATAQLQEVTRAKLETLLSLEIELRRQSEQMQWLDEHIDAQMKHVRIAQNDPSMGKSELVESQLEFIKAWRYYTVYRNSVSRSKPLELQSLASVHADTKVNADIKIYSDPFYDGGNSADGASSSNHNNPSAPIQAFTTDPDLYSQHSSNFNSTNKRYTHAGEVAAAGSTRDRQEKAWEVAATAAGAAAPFLVPMQPTEMLVSSALQSLVDMEMEAVQSALKDVLAEEQQQSSNAERDGGGAGGDMSSLPLSVIRPVVGGRRAPLKLHDLLDAVLDNDFVYKDAPGSTGGSGGGGEGTGPSRGGGESGGMGAVESKYDGVPAVSAIDAQSAFTAALNAAVKSGTYDFVGYDEDDQLYPARAAPDQNKEQYRQVKEPKTARAAQSRSGKPPPAQPTQPPQSQQQQSNSSTQLSQLDTATASQGDLDHLGTSATTHVGGGSGGASTPYQNQQMQPVLANPRMVTKLSATPKAAPRSPPATQQQQSDAVSTPPHHRSSATTLADYGGNDFGAGAGAGHGAGDPQAEINLNISMTAGQLKKSAAAFPSYRLSEIASRKRKQLKAKLGAGAGAGAGAGIGATGGPADMLNSSSVLETQTQAENLFYCLPFFSKLPSCKLLYSTDTMYRSLEEFYNKSVKHRGASVILVRSGEFAFGVYLSHQIVPNCSWAGSPSCFLFSLTNDLKLPYNARTAYGAAATAAAGGGGGGFSPGKTPLAFYAQPDTIYIGNGDLTIEDTLTSGSSELENYYGCGMAARSPETLCCLAGAPLFPIDTLELWAITQ